MVFGQNSENFNFGKKDTIGKSISRGAEWRKFQICSAFLDPVRSKKTAKKMTSILVKTPYYSPWFSAKILKFELRQKRIPSERASQEEQNGANFSSVAPSSEQ